MVTNDKVIVTSFIIIAVVILVLFGALDLLGSESQIIALPIIQYLALFIFSEPIPFQIVLEYLSS